MDDEKLTIAEIATEFKTTPKTVNEWFKRGLPKIKIGRMVRVLRSDLNNFIAGGQA